MKKDPRVYLAHILECTQKIQRYTEGGEEEFYSDAMRQDAVIRNFVKRVWRIVRHDLPVVKEGIERILPPLEELEKELAELETDKAKK